MSTLAQPTPPTQPQAFYAHLDGISGYLTKIEGRLLFLAYGGAIETITPANVHQLDVLGEVGTAVAQYVDDMARGGYAAVACMRDEGRA